MIGIYAVGIGITIMLLKEKDEERVIPKERQSMWKLFRAFLENTNT